MEVEVLVAQVGVSGNVEGDPADPVLGDAVAGCLQHRGGHTAIHEPAHPGLDQRRLQGCHVRGVDLDLIEAPELQAVHAAGGNSTCPQGRDGQETCRGLAVGAGDADNRHLFGRVSREGGSGDAEREPGVLNEGRGARPRQRHLALQQQRSGPGLDSVADEVMRVDTDPGDGYKQLSRRDRAGVLAQPGDFRVELGRREPARGDPVQGQVGQQFREAHFAGDLTGGGFSPAGARAASPPPVGCRC